MTSSDRSDEQAYVLVVFLLLIVLLSTTVATFSLTSMYNLREAESIRNREVGYQMARSGLSLWVGNIKKDWEDNHPGSLCGTKGYSDEGDDGGSTGDQPAECRGFDSLSCSASFSMSRIQAKCCDYEDAPTRGGGGSGGGSSPSGKECYEAYSPDHYWGWGADIINGSSGFGIPMGDTVWIPSETSGPSPRDGDIGYFRILTVEAADGEFHEDGRYLENPEDYDLPKPVSTCRTDAVDPRSDPVAINVNTANYNHLRQVKYDYDTGDTKALSHEMVMALIEERSGSTYDVDEDEGFKLNDEEYSRFLADPFESNSEVCPVLQRVDDTFDDDHGCKPGDYTTGIFKYITVAADDEAGYCARIEGGTLSETGEALQGYQIRAKVRQSPNNDGYEILTIENL